MTHNKSVLIGPMIALAVFTSGAASATILGGDSPSITPSARVSAGDVPLRLAAVDVDRLSSGCTLPAPDLSNLSFWDRYTSPGEPQSVMVPRALLAAVDESAASMPCEGLVRHKTYVVDLPSSVDGHPGVRGS